jgi:processive 1,2-diacylglycerol beta-glucosyltransferase
MRVVVTGGAGFIGSHVCAALLDAPGEIDVVVVDDLSTGRLSNIDRARCRLVVGSVLDSSVLDDAFLGTDAVVHLAAAASVPGSMDDPISCDMVNVGGTVRVLEAARRAGNCHVVLASSSAVYGAGRSALHSEKTPAQPVTPYAASKLAAEWYAQVFAQCFGMDVLALRIFNAFGPGQLAQGRYAAAIPSFVTAANAGRPIPVTGDGRQVRDFIYVGTVAAVIADAVRRRVTCTEPVNVASGTPRSLLEVVAELEHVLGRSLPVEHLPGRPGDVRDSRATVDRMRELFPGVELPAFGAALRATVLARSPEWVQQHAAAEIIEAARLPVTPHSRVVIVSASVGGGHDGAARELARRLVDRGLPVAELDFLDMVPWQGAALTAVYAAMLRWAPWTYQVTYTVLNRSRLLAALGALVMRSGRRRLLKAIPADAAMVVSTYPMASQLLGWLRRRGHLDLPVATFLTDFSVHRLWVAQGIDLHLALHEVSARQAEGFKAARVVTHGSLVGPAFRPLPGPRRAEIRRELGLPVDEPLALLVGGSWGAGDIARAARDVARTGKVAPVVVCARNEALRRRLQAEGIAHTFGWVEQMAELVAAVDVVVQNAGGLTSLEAMACGVPVLSYRCIPGHGRSNAAALEDAGVARWVQRETSLAVTLEELITGPRGRRQRAQGLRLGELDPATAVVDILPSAAPVAEHQPAARPRIRRRLVAVAATVLALSWTGTDGTRLAVAHGLDAVQTTHHQGVYLVVHPHASLDPQTIRALATVQAGVAVDAWLVGSEPDTVRQAAAAGLVLVNAGRGRPYHTGLVGGRTAIRRTAEAIEPFQGHTPRFFLTDSDVDAIDLGILAAAHERIVVPEAWSRNGVIPRIRSGDVLLIECADAPSCRTLVATAEQRAAQQGLPLRSLRELSK